jgi:hypothetical protein
MLANLTQLLGPQEVVEVVVALENFQPKVVVEVAAVTAAVPRYHPEEEEEVADLLVEI